MKMLADLLPDADTLDWTHLCPVDRLKKIPKSKDELCEEAIGVAYDLEISRATDKKEWKVVGGKKSAIGVYFKTKAGELPPLILNVGNSMAAMAALGKDPKQWAGKKITVYIGKADNNPKTKRPCCGVRLRACKGVE